MAYEDKDYESIKEAWKEKITGVAKNEGSLVDFAIMPAALAVEEIYNDLEVADLNCSPLTCDREHLILFGKEDDCEIKTATQAVWLAQINTDVDIGERFECGEMTYAVIKKITDGMYYLQCEEYGTQGNIKQDDDLLPIEYIEGFEEGQLKELIAEATEDEDTEVFRTRYLAAKANSSNMTGSRTYYREKINAITGVGGVKTKRVTQEKKRIDCYVMSETWQAPSLDLIATIQAQVDPLEAQGEGEGIALLCHVVDVHPVDETEIRISCKVELEGKTLNAIKDQMNSAVSEYLLSLNKEWESTERQGIIVRTLKVAEAIASVPGVKDVTDVALNESEDNLELSWNAVTKMGESTYVVN